MSQQDVFLAFLSPISVMPSRNSQPRSTIRGRQVAPRFAKCSRPTRAWQMAEGQPEGSTGTSEEGGQTSASEILKTLREDSAADMKDNDNDPASRSMLGVYRDVDGRSNVWAVEPVEETDTRPQLSKTVIILVAAAFIIGALLVLPLLPFTNPDQL